MQDYIRQHYIDLLNNQFATMSQKNYNLFVNVHNTIFL